MPPAVRVGRGAGTPAILSRVARVTTVELISAPLAKIRSDALVLATSAGEEPSVLGVAGLAKPLRAAVEKAAKVVGVTGALDEVVKVPAPAGLAVPLLVLTGTGLAADAPLAASLGAAGHAWWSAHATIAHAAAAWQRILKEPGPPPRPFAGADGSEHAREVLAAFGVQVDFL